MLLTRVIAPSNTTSEASTRLYPKTQDEIRTTIQEIEGRSPVNGVDPEQQKTINELNVYRYLCGVPFDVESTPDLVELY